MQGASGCRGNSGSDADQGRGEGGDEDDGDEVPTFEEFKHKKLIEQEAAKRTTPEPQLLAIPREKANNYASVDCGAKVVGWSRESQNPDAVLIENKDIYLLSPCSADIWFVIELCDLVAVHTLEVASFELFSSLLKDFTVYSSERYPASEWMPIGDFVASDVRSVQSFPLSDTVYAKYIKVVVNSHFGSDYYCPISLVRVLGASIMEEFQEVESRQGTPPNAPDDAATPTPVIIEESHNDTTSGVDGNSDQQNKTFLSKAKDAVLSLLGQVNQFMTNGNQNMNMAHVNGNGNGPEKIELQDDPIQNWNPSSNVDDGWNLIQNGNGNDDGDDSDSSTETAADDPVSREESSSRGEDPPGEGSSTADTLEVQGQVEVSPVLASPLARPSTTTTSSSCHDDLQSTEVSKVVGPSSEEIGGGVLPLATSVISDSSVLPPVADQVLLVNTKGENPDLMSLDPPTEGEEQVEEEVHSDKGVRITDSVAMETSTPLSEQSLAANGPDVTAADERLQTETVVSEEEPSTQEVQEAGPTSSPPPTKAGLSADRIGGGMIQGAGPDDVGGVVKRVDLNGVRDDETGEGGSPGLPRPTSVEPSDALPVATTGDSPSSTQLSTPLSLADKENESPDTVVEDPHFKLTGNPDGKQVHQNGNGNDNSDGNGSLEVDGGESAALPPLAPSVKTSAVVTADNGNGNSHEHVGNGNGNGNGDLVGENGSGSQLELNGLLANGGKAQEKSVLIRLSNRVRDLEQNISLFSSYLDQLSTSMKKNKNKTEEINRRLSLLEGRLSSLQAESSQHSFLLRQLHKDLVVLVDTVRSTPQYYSQDRLTLALAGVVAVLLAFCSVCLLYLVMGRTLNTSRK